jgi:capsular polysaccharide transport system permease protein
LNQINTLDRRTAFQIQRDVVQALFVREMKTRFGKSKTGYIWTVLEPMCLIAFHSAYILVNSSARGNYFIAGVPVVLFFMTAIIPYFLFRNIFAYVGTSVEANRQLFSYRQVKPIDAMIARTLLECIIYVFVYIFLISLARLAGYPMTIFDPLGLIGIYSLLILMSFGVGIILCVLNHLYHDTMKVYHVLIYVMYFISGTYFTLESIPKKYWPLIIWNPMLHFAELGRARIFEQFTSHANGSLFYVLSFTGIVWFFAAFLYRLYWKEMISAS